MATGTALRQLGDARRDPTCCIAGQTGWPLLAFTTKQPPMSSTDHGGGNRWHLDVA
jgi:hypothetical protein